MEVKKSPKLASQFWTNFFRSGFWTLILIQLLITVGLWVSLYLAGFHSDSPTNTIVIVCLFMVVSIIANGLIFIWSTKPTKHLISAIVSVSGEKSNMTPPNPNSLNLKHNGLGDAIQTIYQLASEKVKSKPNTTSNDLLRQALEKSKVGFIALDSKNKIIYANKIAPVHTEPDASLQIDLIFGNDSITTWLETCRASKLKAEHIWTRIPNRYPGDEDRRFFDVIATYQKGEVPETVIATVDRTIDYADDEEDLDFVAFAAHELRGPITVIRGYLDVLDEELDDVLHDDQHELFHRLIVSTNRLSGYVNNILNTSRYDSRHLKMNLLEETIPGIYGVISDDMQLRAKTQNRLLSVQFPDNLPTVAADRSSMSEVFCNLIDNAIKYSNDGGVINVSAKSSSSCVEFSVQDYGIGMPPSVINKLFHKFYRSHRSRETVAGTGIGLYISKGIVESHGGTISVRSEEGKGSTFTVSLPIYATVAEKLKLNNNSNVGMISEGKGWIKNHSMYRG